MSRLAVASAAAFAILCSLNYYVQWAAVRQDILKGKTEGLELFVQFNFDSPMSAIKMLGWTLFSILLALAVVSLFKGGRVDK